MKKYELFIVFLLIWLMADLWGLVPKTPMNWDVLNLIVDLPWGQIIDSGEKVFKILAIIAAGFWAYYKFFKGRTFSSRLELDLVGKQITVEGRDYLDVVAKIKNLGLSKIPIYSGTTVLRIFSPKLRKTVTFVDCTAWDRVATVSAFEGQEWIEPGESLQDHCLIDLPGSAGSLFKVELRVASKTAWVTAKIIGRGNESPTSIERKTHEQQPQPKRSESIESAPTA